MPNLESDPPVDVYMDPVTVYHAQPVHNRIPTGELVTPHFFVDAGPVMQRKLDALGCHASQKQWLDESQGMDSYLETARQVSRETGQMSGKYEYAEGWRKRQHWGFCGPNDDPLSEALADVVVRS
jgi:LmbE family N-acetylglucosaminyl deacetylase